MRSPKRGFPTVVIASSVTITAVLVATSGAYAQTTIDVATDGTDVATGIEMGETITAPTGSDTRLDSFQVYGNSAGGNVTFEALVYSFDPADPETLSAPLYTSTPQIAFSVNSLQTFTFTTGGIDLAPGKQVLIALLQQNNPNFSNLQMAATQTAYTGGEFWIYSNAFDSWIVRSPPAALAFQAVFDNPVPEPASLSILALGALLLLRRHKGG